MFKKILRFVFLLIATAILVATVIPLLFSEFYFTRVLDFLRLEWIVWGVISIAGLFWLIKEITVIEKILAALVLVSVVYHCYVVSPYTFFHSKTVADAADNNQATVSILVANVLQTNRQWEKTLTEIKQQDADIVLALEINTWWLQKLDTLKATHYPYTYAKPLDNKYGMVVYSKYELRNAEWRYMSDPGIPSLHGTIELPGGKQFVFNALHPRPPRLGSDTEYPLLKISREAGESNQPQIVAGDLNDVGWSKRMRQLRKEGKVKDPRVGRGFINTYHAQNLLFFWPLDYVLVTPHFKLIEMHRTEDIGSDHFPFYTKVAL